MGMLHSTVTIIENQVVFSKEILKYFESLRNEETNEWVDKYIEVLSDTSNFDAPKFNIHHIKPVFTFKTEELNTRRKAVKIADKFNGNTIKLSIYNHILAHFYLWKIYNNNETKYPLCYLFNTHKTIDKLTEKELKIIAKLTEDVTKTNLTEEETKQRKKEYYEKTKEEKNKKRQAYVIKNKNKIQKYQKDRDSRLCLDPITNLPITFGKLRRMHERYEEYKEVDAKKCLITENLEYYEDLYNKLLQDKENNKKTKDEKQYQNNWRNRLCINPFNGEIITYQQLRNLPNILNIYNNIHQFIITENLEYYKNLYEENKIKKQKQIEENKSHQKERSSTRSKNSRHRICKDPRYNVIFPINMSKDFKYTEYTTFGALKNWATFHKTHPLVNNMNPTEWATQFLIEEEKEKTINDDKNICKDPRYGLKTKYKTFRNKYTVFSSLKSWARDNPSHPLVNNMNPSKWATQFILTPQELDEYYKTHPKE